MLSTKIILNKKNFCLSSAISSCHIIRKSVSYYSPSYVSRRTLIILIITILLMFDAVNCQHPHKRQPRHGKSLCHQKKTGYHAHPRDPTKYVHCYKGNAYVYYCGKGTTFNSEKELCLADNSKKASQVSWINSLKKHRNKKATGDEESAVVGLNHHKRRYNVILV
uniref:CSON004733 protein n=1 Tax=Culicoides sonorensis TaxID=179676 RepID=A0A336LU12_CULSO